MYDVKKAMRWLAAQPDVRKAMADLRKGGFGEIVDTFGLSRGRSMILPGISLFAVGAVCGAAAAVLLTPKSGEELRKDIMDAFESMKTQIDEKVATVKRNGQSRLRDNGASAPA